MEIKLLKIREAVGIKINRPEDVVNLMHEEAKADRECFWVIHLNTEAKVIEKELVSIGILNTAYVHPREVFKKAILNSSYGIITVHNHTGENVTPSIADRDVWRVLEQAGKILGIEVKDNMIICSNNDEYYTQRKAEVWELSK